MPDQPRGQAAPDAAPAPVPGESAKTAPRPGARQHTGRLLLWSLLAPLALILALVTSALVWAASAGSLATALRMAEARLPALRASGVSGAILGGGRIAHLSWEKDGLDVRMDDLVLAWSPRALLRRTLDIRELSAQRITVQDHRPPNPAPSSGPPHLPLPPLVLRVDALRVGKVQWDGPPALALRQLTARLATRGTHYQLDVDRADFDRGRYQARALIGAGRTMTLDIALAGALVTPAADGMAPQPVTLQATLQGPIHRMLARADLSVSAADAAAELPALPAIPKTGANRDRTSGGATAAPAQTNGPALHVVAHITPWETFPLSEARASLRAFDAATLLRGAPRTLLSGELNLAPGTEAARKDWVVTAQIDNHAAGPWDKHQLPIEAVTARATWREHGAALLDALAVKLAGGTLDATGRVGPLPSDTQPTHAAAAPGDRAGAPWQIKTRITDIHPERLLSTLAGAPISGIADAEGTGAAPIRFDVALQAAHAPAGRRRQGAAATLDLRDLRLRDLDARGEWADGWLTLERVLVKSDDAEIAGRARVRPANRDAWAGSANLRFTAPGAHAVVQGELQPNQGAGNVALAVSDAARWLAWARTLPGAARALDGANAQGTLDLTGQWRGGWRDPALQARLATPRLSVLAPSRGANAAPPAPLALRGVELTLNGRLAQAQLRTRGSLQQGKRQLQWTLAAAGGRTTPRASLARSDWRLNLTELQLRLDDPALGSGAWQAATTGDVPVTWARGVLDIAPGTLRITAPASSTPASVAWKETRWQRGLLQTSGHIAGVPLEWMNLLNAARNNKGAYLTGNLVFNGDWNIQAGRTLQAKIEVARASGDLTLLATDPETDVQSRISAGLREARVRLELSGENVNATALWDSARAGHVEAALQTQLAANPDKNAAFPWRWSTTAPIQGRIQARLPTISTWSILAPPGWRLRGALAADIRVAGSAAEPQLSGTLTADQLALRSVVDGVQLQDGTLRAHLEGSRLVLDQFTLHGPGADGGTVSATGEAGWLAGQFQARLAATIDQLRASVRSDRKVTVSGTLTTAFSDGLVRADGTVHVDHALIVLPNSSRPTLGSDVVVHGAGANASGGTSGKTHAEAAGAPPGRLKAKVDVKIDLGDDFQLRGMGIETRLAGMLALTADGPLAQMPTLKGRVQTEGGRFQAYGQKLAIARGRIFFSGDVTNPGLDILALRPNYTSDQKVGVEVQGTALLPQVHLYSDPALPDNQTLAWLMLGHAAPENGGEAALLQSAALAFLGGRESAGLASTFGLDQLSFGQNNGVGQTGSNLTLGKRISDRLYAAYEQGLGGATSVLMIFYELSKRWVVRGQAGATSAIDLIFKLNYGS